MSSKDNKIQKNGLTTQEYSFKHAIPIETLLKNESSAEVKKALQTISNNNPNEEQKNILKAYQDLSLLKVVDSEIHIYEEIRKLDYLYWVENKLNNLGFIFHENNKYSDESHKIITKNFIATNKKNISIIDIQNYEINNFNLYLSIILMCKGYILDGYIYLKDIDENILKIIKKNLDLSNIQITRLSISKDLWIARIKTKEDCEKLKNKLDPCIKDIPCFYEKFFQKTPKASITKKLVFDSAHYITDHEGKCKNLHGGRYDIEIKVKGRIDPMTGFVIDYSLIKNITKNLIINKFDHKTLNLTCPELAWRSSTEFLSVFIWEELIEFLPNLKKIKIYETETSFCEYEGVSLSDYIKNGPNEILKYFKNLDRDFTKKEKKSLGS
jgi:6-pyruvoyl tetrahydropterin synthase/QueD family protein